MIQKQKSKLFEVGQLLLITGLLAGTFNLGRLHVSLAIIDVRLVFLGLLVFILFLLNNTEQDRIAPKTQLTVYLFLFATWCVWLVSSALWTVGENQVNEYLADLTYLMAFVLVSYHMTRYRNPPPVFTLWYFLIAVGYIYLIAALVAGPGDQGRYSALGGGPNVFVRVLSFSIIAAVYLFYVTHKYQYLLLVSPLLVGVLLSGSRGGMLALGVSSLVVLTYFFRHLKLRTIALIFISMGLLIWATWINLNATIQAWIVDRFFETTIIQGYSSGRDSRYLKALELISEKSVIGHGLAGYEGITGLNHPHNIFLNTSSESGLIGGVLLFFAILTGFVCALKKPLSAESFFFVVLSLYILVTSQVSGDYYDTRFMWVFLILASYSNLPGRGNSQNLQSMKHER